jgi:hypothetical protein
MKVQIFVINVLTEVRKLPQILTFLAHSPVFVSRFKIRDCFQEKCWRRSASRFQKSAEGRPFRAMIGVRVGLIGMQRLCVMLVLCSVLFGYITLLSVLFCPALLCSIPFYSMLILLYPFSCIPILFHSVLFCSHSIPFNFIVFLFYHIPIYSVLFSCHSVLILIY